jgi:hypothetical protein
VTVEVVDDHGQRALNAELPVRFTVSRAGKLVAPGNGSPNQPASFRAPLHPTFERCCLAILRPLGPWGIIKVEAEANGLASETTAVQVR